jgi:hypothetical protein
MRVPDRQKQRWEYLRKKAGKHSYVFIMGVFWLCAALATLLCGLLTCLGLIQGFLGTGLTYPLFLPFLMTVVGGYVSWLIYRYTNRVEKEALSIPFVPPFTPDTLPAEEVLVRGSEEPTQEQNTVLLRAAEESADIPAVQLLRASVGEEGK